MVTHKWSRPCALIGFWTAESKAFELSPKGCGLAELSTHERSRLKGLFTHKRSRECAYLVAPLIKNLYLPFFKMPLVGAAPNVHNLSGCTQTACPRYSPTPSGRAPQGGFLSLL